MSDDAMTIADYLSAIEFNQQITANTFGVIAGIATRRPGPSIAIGTRGEIVLEQARIARAYERDLARLRRGLVRAQRKQFRAEQGMSDRAPIDPVLFAIRFPANG